MNKVLEPTGTFGMDRESTPVSLRQLVNTLSRYGEKCVHLLVEEWWRSAEMDSGRIKWLD